MTDKKNQTKKASKPLSEKIKDEIVKDIFVSKDKRPNLAIIIIGDDHKCFNNIKDLEKEAKKIGIDTNLYVCENETREEDLIAVIEHLNKDDEIDTIYIQLPLAKEMDESRILQTIISEKDINFEDSAKIKDWALHEAQIFKATLERSKEK